jgi:hypothetical protein
MRKAQVRSTHFLLCSIWAKIFFTIKFIKLRNLKKDYHVYSRTEIDQHALKQTVHHGY